MNANGPHPAARQASANQPLMAVVVGAPDVSPAMSVIAAPVALPTQLAQQPEQHWEMSGHFPYLRSYPLPTRLAIVLVMLLSAASAYAFVRLMSERCRNCSALLQRHSAGCRSCGAHWSSSGQSWRVSS